MTKILSLQDVKKEISNIIHEEYGKDQFNRIIKVMNGYGKREGFFNKIGGVFYRIWNAVKAVFGQSDWQLAGKDVKEMFKKSIYDQAKMDLETFNMNLETLSKHLIKKTEKFANDFGSSMYDAILNKVIRGTYIKAQSSDEIQSKFDDLGVAKMDKISQSFTKREAELKTEVYKYIEDKKAKNNNNNL
jgi:hypothetical protein